MLLLCKLFLELTIFADGFLSLMYADGDLENYPVYQWPAEVTTSYLAAQSI